MKNSIVIPDNINGVCEVFCRIRVCCDKYTTFAVRSENVDHRERPSKGTQSFHDHVVGHKKRNDRINGINLICNSYIYLIQLLCDRFPGAVPEDPRGSVIVKEDRAQQYNKHNQRNRDRDKGAQG